MSTLKAQLAPLVAQYGAATVAAAIGALVAKECKRCGNTWTPRAPGEPRQCPRCKSALWHTERRMI